MEGAGRHARAYPYVDVLWQNSGSQFPGLTPNVTVLAEGEEKSFKITDHGVGVRLPILLPICRIINRQNMAQIQSCMSASEMHLLASLISWTILAHSASSTHLLHALQVPAGFSLLQLQLLQQVGQIRPHVPHWASTGPGLLHFLRQFDPVAHNRVVKEKAQRSGIVYIRRGGGGSEGGGGLAQRFSLDKDHTRDSVFRSVTLTLTEWVGKLYTLFGWCDPTYRKQNKARFVLSPLPQWLKMVMSARVA